MSESNQCDHTKLASSIGPLQKTNAPDQHIMHKCPQGYSDALDRPCLPAEPIMTLGRTERGCAAHARMPGHRRWSIESPRSDIVQRISRPGRISNSLDSDILVLSGDTPLLAWCCDAVSPVLDNFQRLSHSHPRLHTVITSKTLRAAFVIAKSFRDMLGTLDSSSVSKAIPSPWLHL